MRTFEIRSRKKCLHTGMLITTVTLVDVIDGKMVEREPEIILEDPLAAKVEDKDPRGRQPRRFA